MNLLLFLFNEALPKYHKLNENVTTKAFYVFRPWNLPPYPAKINHG